MTSVVIFFGILIVGMLTLWAFLRHADKHQRVSFFGLNPTSRTDDPEKFERVVRSYRLQMFALSIIAAFVAAFSEIS